MADEADLAQEMEERHRQRAIAVARARETDTPLEVNGTRLCLDCGEKIPRRRLHAVPHAVRCMFCQVAHEEG